MWTAGVNNVYQNRLFHVFAHLLSSLRLHEIKGPELWGKHKVNTDRDFVSLTYSAKIVGVLFIIQDFTRRYFK